MGFDGGRDIARILIVDDELAVLSVLTDMVRELGHDPEAVASGRDAITSLDRVRPDLVILDLVIPDTPGPDVLAHVHDRYPGVPVIMLTGTIEDFGDRARQLGAYAFVEKPIRFGELARLLTSALGGGRRA